jgi:hypothetical protein
MSQDCQRPKITLQDHSCNHLDFVAIHFEIRVAECHHARQLDDNVSNLGFCHARAKSDHPKEFPQRLCIRAPSTQNLLQMTLDSLIGNGRADQHFSNDGNTGRVISSLRTLDERNRSDFERTSATTKLVKKDILWRLAIRVAHGNFNRLPNPVLGLDLDADDFDKGQALSQLHKSIASRFLSRTQFDKRVLCRPMIDGSAVRLHLKRCKENNDAHMNLTFQ